MTMQYGICSVINQRKTYFYSLLKINKKSKEIYCIKSQIICLVLFRSMFVLLVTIICYSADLLYARITRSRLVSVKLDKGLKQSIF